MTDPSGSTVTGTAADGGSGGSGGLGVSSALIAALLVAFLFAGAAYFGTSE
jgi:hypothetical protein